MLERYTCRIEDAPQIWDWVKNRGGIAVWTSVDLCNPGKSWTTPVLTKEGNISGKPSWQAADAPAQIITNPDEILVSKDKIVARFHVAIRPSRDNFGPLLGFIPRRIELTTGSSNRVEKAVRKAGEGAYHVFDYGTQEAVILAPVSTTTLTEWHNQLKTKEDTNGTHSS